MARGKFNKRGGGKRLDAQSAEEIELRNERLAAFEEERTRRRAEEAEDGDGADAEKGDDDKTVEAGTGTGASKKKQPEEEKGPVKVTSAEEHKRNLSKLEAVRKRRAEAEEKRKQEEEAANMAENERKMAAAALRDNSDDEADSKKKKGKKPEIPKLSKIDIKKMKPALLKEALKERGLEIQGNAKTLTARLLAYEEAR